MEEERQIWRGMEVGVSKVVFREQWKEEVTEQGTG